MDITHGGGDAWRFLDDDAKAAVGQAEDFLREHLAPPYRYAADAHAARILKSLLRTIEELHDRVQMAESYVETATQAVMDEFDVPGLAFDQIPHVPGLQSCECMLCRHARGVDE